MIPGYAISLDFIGVDDPWIGVDPDMDVLRRIVCETFRISDSEWSDTLSLRHEAFNRCLLCLRETICM
jgi:hypothetical protein